MNRQTGERLAIELDQSAVGRNQAHDHVEARRLACAVGTQQPHHFAAAYFERHVVNDGARLVSLFEPRGGELAHFAGAGASSPAGFNGSGMVPVAGAAAGLLSVGPFVLLPSGLSAFGWNTPLTRTDAAASAGAFGLGGRLSALNNSVCAL